MIRLKNPGKIPDDSGITQLCYNCITIIEDFYFFDENAVNQRFRPEFAIIIASS